MQLCEQERINKLLSTVERDRETAEVKCETWMWNLNDIEYQQANG